MKVQSLDSCFINSNHALEACPKLYQNTQEIFLIRKYYLLSTHTGSTKYFTWNWFLNFSGTNQSHHEFCPFLGHFNLYYEENENSDLCYELSNCDGGYELKIRSRPCQHTDNLEKVTVSTLQCLGHWPTNFPGKFLAIFREEDVYKCAVSTKYAIFVNKQLFVIWSNCIDTRNDGELSTKILWFSINLAFSELFWNCEEIFKKVPWKQLISY